MDEIIVWTRPAARAYAGRGGAPAGPAAADLRRALAGVPGTLRPFPGEPGRLRLLLDDRAGADPADVARRLREAAPATVAGAYVKPPAVPAVFDWTAVEREQLPPAAETPDYSPRQGYLRPAAKGGIGAEAAWALRGGLGDGIGVIDVELDWDLEHEDLREGRDRPGGDSEEARRARNHGTAVLGMLAAVHNGRGINGICPGATVGCVSVGRNEWATSTCIRRAALRLGPGAILLIELQRKPGEADDPGAYLPLEWWPDDHAAIRFATGRGVIVVAAAGNGGVRLDTPPAGAAAGFPASPWEPFAPALDSGAILVGAGAPPRAPHGAGTRRTQPTGDDRSALPFSNHGPRVDVQGWGYDVTTTGGVDAGFGDLQGGPDARRWYTDAFNGTSSAAPMVAGALACVQGILRAEGRRLLTPAQARRLLRETGRPQPAGEDRLVGPRPDLEQAIPMARELADRPTVPTRRRTAMRVTITIDDGAEAGVSDPGAIALYGNGAAPVPNPRGGLNVSSLDVAHVRGPGYDVTAGDESTFLEVTRDDFEKLKDFFERQDAAKRASSA
jgi:hypothetical protein